MFRQNFIPNQQDQSPAYGRQRNDAFRSPMAMQQSQRPRFQNSPRYHQQFVPHHSAASPNQMALFAPPYSSSPHNQNGRSPQGASPGPGGPRMCYRSPPPLGTTFDVGVPAGGVYPSPRRHHSGGGRPAGAGGASTPDSVTSTPSSASGCGASRANNQSRTAASPWRDSDVNPGASSNIRQYFSASMLSDPWLHLQRRAELGGATT